MIPFTFLSSAVGSWSAFYEGHQTVSVGVRFLHLAGLVVGAGTALATDRHLLRAGRTAAADDARVRGLTALAASHRVVVPALAVVMASGALMALSDSATFVGSRLFWTKMTLVALLLANGAGLLRAEARAARGDGWGWLRAASAASMVLWLLILYCGVWLTVAA